MNVRVDAEKSKSLKVKLQPDEVNVRVGKHGSNERAASSSSAVLLKAQFEEALTALRHERPFAIQCSSTPPDGSLHPTSPSLDAQHPLLQSLLKLVWETHLARFHAVVRVFDAGIQMKLHNTQCLLDLRLRMKASAESLIDELHTSSMNRVREEFRSTWLDTLNHAQTALDMKGMDIDDLLAEALRRLQSTGAEPWDMKTDEVLGTLRTEFQSSSQHLWDEWTLHMKRHRFVFEGKMSEVERVDKELVHSHARQVSRTGGAPPSPDARTTSPDARTTPQKHGNEREEAWRQLVTVLHAIKLDFDIQATCVARLKASTLQKLEESRASAYAAHFSTIVQQEDAQLQEAKNALSRELEDISVSRDRILRELSLACNNSLRHVDTILKAMQFSCDLAMESARESSYLRGLQTLKTFRV